MSKVAYRVVFLGAVIALLGVVSFAVAGGGSKNFEGSPLNGYEENPDVSSIGSGEFEARLDKDGDSIEYKLSYSNLESTVTQAHIHFGKRAVNGGISMFLCSNLGNGPAGTQACPQSGTITGTLDASDVIGPVRPGDRWRESSTRSSPRCGPGTPTPTSIRRRSPAERSGRRSTTTATTRRSPRRRRLGGAGTGPWLRPGPVPTSLAG